MEESMKPIYKGLEDRDRFAIAALSGMLASAPLCNRSKINKAAWAKVAYAWADAMLIAKEKK